MLTRKEVIMTIKEVALQLGLKESTLKRNFPRTQETLRKKGIILMRWGYGKKAMGES